MRGTRNRSRAASALSLMCVVALAGCGAAGVAASRAAARADAVGTATYPVVDTSQASCYGNSLPIDAPSAGQAFYGQDAQYAGSQPSYTLSADGLTVRDNVTGLTWQSSPESDGGSTITAADKFTLSGATARPAALNAAGYGGYTDWRLPTIKELYSLIRFNGTDPNFMYGDTSGLTPFIDTDYFRFAYGDTGAGERVIDSQYASSTSYAASSNKLFGVNFADGRIKGYDLTMPGGREKTFFVQCVRGNPDYGKNSFTGNGDGTVTDAATGLMWAQADNGSGLDWQQALAWAQAKNGEGYLGHSDWRLPDAKELQSIVDYSRSPDTTASAAIDPLFSCTSITNEAGQADFPYYWTSTTHASSDGRGDTADYVAFGRAPGYMNGVWVDVHGAGAQRSDPKSGDPADYPQGRGPQGDAIRIYNYVRLVRDAGPSVAALPVVESLSPTWGYAGGTVVTLSGSGFGASGSVWFGASRATTLAWSDGSVRARVSAGAQGRCSVKVWTPAGVSNAKAFDVRPVVTMVSPASGRAGTLLTIAGGAFGNLQGAGRVYFGNRAVTEVVSWKQSQVKVRVPAGLTGTVPVQVYTTGGKSNARAVRVI